MYFVYNDWHVKFPFLSKKVEGGVDKVFFVLIGWYHKNKIIHFVPGFRLNLFFILYLS